MEATGRPRLRGVMGVMLAALAFTAVGACKTDRPPAAAPLAQAAASEVVVRSLPRQGDVSLEDLFRAELDLAAASDRQVVVLFTADWCTPCRTIKELLDGHPLVRTLTGKGHFVIVDVDTWRGPAQRLIAGTDPSKLPLLVRVDEDGKQVVQAHGSRLGLLDAQTTGDNLARLVAGQDIVRPGYMNDPERQRALVREDMKRLRASVVGQEPFHAEIVGRVALGDGRVRLRIDLRLRNLEAPRRWYVLPTAAPPPEGPLTATAVTGMRFMDHVRAGVVRYATEPPLQLIPVGNWGSVSLTGWTVDVAPGTKTLEVWKLAQAEVDGERLPFAKKVPYALAVQKASRLQWGRTIEGDRTLELKVAERYTIGL